MNTMGDIPVTDWTFVKDFKRHSFKKVVDLERYYRMHFQAASNLEKDMEQQEKGRRLA